MIKNIMILGSGHMGTWLVEELCNDFEVAIYDPNPRKMKYLFKAHRMQTLSQVKEFCPDLLINAVSLNNTIRAFDEVSPFLEHDCIISDIASVKEDIKEYYKKSSFSFVSTHPMFGPTFSNIRNLKDESAIIISESCSEGKEFFQQFYYSLGLNIYEYTFIEHDKTTAYSLSIPFVSSMVFAAVMKHQDAPGSTFKKHLQIANGLLSEDDYLLAEILFNPNTLEQVEKINSQLSYLTHIIKGRDHEEMVKFFNRLRDNTK